MAKGIFNIIIAIISIILLVSCQNSEPDEVVEPETDYVYIVKDGISDYWVIRGDYSKGADVEAAVGIRKLLSEKASTEIGISTDWEKNPVYEHEIIIGKTLRESDEFQIDRTALGETGYIIKERNGKIYISGGSDVGTQLAFECFVKNFITSDADVKIPVDYELIVYHQYDIPELYVAMNQVNDTYKIIIPSEAGKDFTQAAEKLRDVIYDKAGIMLKIQTGSEADKNAFVLSDTVPETKGVHDISVEGTNVVFKTSASSGILSCVDTFINKYLYNVYGKYNIPTDFRYFDLGDHMIVIYPNN